MAKVLSIHVGRIKGLAAKPEKRSAIDKGEVTGPVKITKNGLEGDQQSDLRYHGGIYKAICTYPSEYYSIWADEFDARMPAGSFGENFHTQGLLDEEACLGDIYRSGDVTMDVTGPRGPCSNVSTHWNRPGMHLKLKSYRKSGLYMRVREEGAVSAGAELQLDERAFPKWTIAQFWNAIDGGTPTAGELEEILSIDALADDWRRDIERKLRRTR